MSLDCRRFDRVAVATVIVMAVVFGAQQGVTYPLLALRLAAAGHTAGLIGLNAAMLPLGLIVAAFVAGPALARVGAARTALVSCGLVVSATVILMATPSLGAWFAARLLLGIGIGGVYVVSETWLNMMVPTRERGRWLALYATAIGAGFAAGPALLLLTGTAGPSAFLVTLALTLLMAALITAAAARLPAIELAAKPSLARFARLAPLLLFAVAGAAAFDQAVLTLLPIYALALGASETGAKLTVTALALGTVLLQWPLGWLADRTSRRAATLLCTALTALGCIVLAGVGTWSPWLWALVFFWGGLAYGTYTMALIALGDRFQGALLVAGNAAFALVWGVAGLVGPTASGVAMDVLGASGLPVVLGLAFAGLTAAVWCRPRALDSTGLLA